MVINIGGRACLELVKRKYIFTVIIKYLFRDVNKDVGPRFITTIIEAWPTHL